MIVWIAQVHNIGNHVEDTFSSVYVAKSKIGLYAKITPTFCRTF
jgi:hypothetical protein